VKPEPELHDDGGGADDRSVTMAHDTLRTAILRDELELGSPVSQVQLARQLGISRSPLREALKMLEREGLVVAEPNRRVRIAGVSVEDLEDLYAMRITLEAFATAVTVPRLSAAELDKLREDVSDMDRLIAAEDHEGWHVPHRAFHSGLIQHAGARLRTTADQLSDHSDRYRRIHLEQPLSYSRGSAEHRALLEAAAQRDAAGAARVLADHLARTALSVLAQMDPAHEPQLLRAAVRSTRTSAGT
jgi:DNA-binding GntR family transcriptional regulator